MNQKQEFIKEMKNKGFQIISKDFMGQLDLIPSHRKTQEGNHNIISKICFVLFSGVNTKDGDLGCISLYYSGKQRQKHCRNIQTTEILKKAFCPKSVKDAIQTFDVWNMESYKTINSWQTIL